MNLLLYNFNISFLFDFSRVLGIYYTCMRYPCYKCENREVGCHSTCHEYLATQKENAEIKHKEDLEKVWFGYRDENSRSIQKQWHRKPRTGQR